MKSGGKGNGIKLSTWTLPNQGPGNLPIGFARAVIQLIKKADADNQKFVKKADADYHLSKHKKQKEALTGSQCSLKGRRFNSSKKLTRITM